MDSRGEILWNLVEERLIVLRWNDGGRGENAAAHVFGPLADDEPDHNGEEQRGQLGF